MSFPSSSCLFRLALGAFAFASFISARAGVVYEMSNTDHVGGVAGQAMLSRVLVDGDNLKMSWPDDASGEKGEMIFRADKKEMIMVDHKKRQYFVFDQTTLDEIAAKMNQAMEMLKNVPPAQRAMMEKMMKGSMPQMGGVEKKEIEVRKYVDTVKVMIEIGKEKEKEKERKESEEWMESGGIFGGGNKKRGCLWGRMRKQ